MVPLKTQFQKSVPRAKEMPSLKPFVANFGRRSRQNDAALNNTERGCATVVITAGDETATALSDQANPFSGPLTFGTSTPSAAGRCSSTVDLS